MHLSVPSVLTTVTVLTALPLLQPMAGSGQTCVPEALRQSVEQLQDNQKRPEAQKALQTCGEEAVQPLVSALTNPKTAIRRNAAQALGLMGQDAKAAATALKDRATKDNDLAVRSSAVQALSKIGQDIRDQADQLRGWDVGEIQAIEAYQQQLDATLAALEKDAKDWPNKKADLISLGLTRDGLGNQLALITDQWVYKPMAWGQSNPWLVVTVVGVIVVVLVYGAVWWFRPLCLLNLTDGGIEAISKLPTVGTPVSGALKVLVPLKYHPRVLDAWVEQHWQQVERAFLALDTVKDRQIHISLPVTLGQEKRFINELSGDDLVATFQKNPAVLLIVGEGGAGKTSLACQIAQWGLQKQLASHRLLPVLVETELDDKKTLVEAIRGQLNALISKPEDLPLDLLEKLLQRQRILVIVDHFSETGEATRKQVTPELATFPAKALVITSRLEESLGGVPKTILRPQRIEADRLLGFMQAYVRWKLNKQDDPFVDDEYAIACDRLRRMVRQGNITVLLARLYTEEMIRQQQGSGDLPPASVQDLMLSYLKQLNDQIEPANRRDYQQVRQDALVIAWECLKQTYRPTVTLREGVIQALRATQPAADLTVQDKASAASLDYLENRLLLLQTLDNKIKIVLDPLAEYLAATWLIDRSRSQTNSSDSEDFWLWFLESIDPILQQSNDPPAAIQGFLLAVRDCCLVNQKEARIPDAVPEELARRAGLDPEELRRDEEKRRIRLLISDLSAPELEFRIEAAEKLGKRGMAAREAGRNLIGMMENRNQEMESRQAAVQTLGKLGIGADNLLALLMNPDEDLALRRSAAESLGVMKAKQPELLQLLESDDQPLSIRQGAARALSLIGAASGETVPMLLVKLNGEPPQIIKSIPVWRESLTENLTLDLVNIPAGEFLMGSPADEASRDWYARSYPDTEGLDVEAQHQVKVSAFSISQHPITQAQWRFVAALPKVERELNLDPASHKGDNRPVETVSWYDAMEFCARLSQHRGKTYRLPSEAEWEYACRGGTTTPFHFGGTLSTEIANYNGNYTCGDGEKGEYLNKTAEVGSFGVVNAFGLFDMHGNVWEWCLDHWHPSYEGAPTDGSAWIKDGDDRYRLLRGGSWFPAPDYCHSALRFRNTPYSQNHVSGFRVICLSPWTR
ncbi:MAG: SUMF1/EgtB/PvdO family nonheme iron enzyme [Pegethrix bostrychoides GSE-TBD4-15B]|jgi:formylglycine-generating enzyme required for sulfatase activity/flagellar biosynthesis GTPase FlhF|uniref:SUMF1/EgtB/PvdO family nonheme iron enzyme n=1 Tax=Pegethrix bostrychoides GSE-TBD4-15B TaxID=2839662 RepID=A0A951U4M3_9CYAN|nr:SUMF1/EgtB/PvdO family nonheme iron enzyme [Pegethrix bostrychoides GSE-TBD4-15B]